MHEVSPLSLVYNLLAKPCLMWMLFGERLFFERGFLLLIKGTVG